MTAHLEVPSAGWHIAADGDWEEATGLRTDFAICQCPRPGANVHPQSWFVRRLGDTRPPDVVVDRYPGGHLVEQEIAWTGWRAA